MLHVPGTGGHRRTSSGRRALLQAGALGLSGLAGGPLQKLFARQPSSTGEFPGFGRARRCLVRRLRNRWLEDSSPILVHDDSYPTARARLVPFYVPF